GLSAYPGGTWQRAQEAAQAVGDLATSQFQVINILSSAMGRVMTEPGCGMQHMVLYVGANLKVYRCCYVAYTALGECGDLSAQSLAEYLSSSQRHQSLQDFDARSCST